MLLLCAPPRAMFSGSRLGGRGALTRLPLPAPPGPKHDQRIVLMAESDGSLRYENEDGVVDVKSVVLGRKERERERDRCR